MRKLRQWDWVFIVATIFALFALIGFVCGCEQIFGTDEDDIDIRIHVTGFGQSGGSSFQRGYVKNHSGPKVVGVKVQWSTSNDSGSDTCSPSVLNQGDEGKYYFSYTGSGLKTSVDYRKE